MSSNAVRAARHRRSLHAGLAISAAAHIAALAAVTVPGAPARSQADGATRAERPFPALRVVELDVAPEASAEPVTATAASAASAVSRSTPVRPAAASEAPTPGAVATAAAPSLHALLGALTAANPSGARVDRSRPISPFKRLEAVAGSGGAAADGVTGAAEAADEERSMWREILDGITISVGAGPYCPVRGGPLIMR